MGATSEGAVVVPDDEQGEEARRENAVNGELGAEEAVPVLDRVTGPDGRLPGDHEDPARRSARLGELGDEVIPTRSEDGAVLPGPGDQGDASVAEDDGGI